MRKHNRLALVLAMLLECGWMSLGSPEIAVGAEHSLSKQQTSRTGRKVSGVQRIWKDPGAVEKLDFVGGPAGRFRAPRPPFRFVEEDLEGSTPKIKVTDARNHTWVIKWGPEVNAEVFATRMAWASGYFVDATYFVQSGVILGVRDLKRAKSVVAPDGRFTDARFELRDKNARFLKNNNWTWHNNPFVGTRELNGLKVIMMLTSNWDNKDARDQDRGPNTGILEYRMKDCVELRYLITDWGGSMGRWGKVFTREKWDCEGFTGQTPDFIKGIKDGEIKWGYIAQHSSDTKSDIRISDVKWLLRYVGRITDRQIKTGLAASGATAAENHCFARAIRNRIEQTKRVVKGVSPQLSSIHRRPDPVSEIKQYGLHQGTLY